MTAPRRRATGVDVAARRGLDVVTLGSDRALVGPPVHLDGPRELRAHLERLRPDVVAIDAPPAWRAGERPRAGETALLRRRIHCYLTPAAERAGSPFYDWMRTGFECFDAAAAAGYPRYRRPGTARNRALEAFPHAAAVVIAGPPAPGEHRRPAAKRARRAEALARSGVALEELRTMDQLDAALCALIGLLALERRVEHLGDPGDGWITLPDVG